MPRLTDPDILARYKQALAEWKVEGAIELIGRAPMRGYERPWKA